MPAANISAAQIAANTPRPEGSQTERQAREAAESFEAIFLAQMLNSMFSGIESDGPFSGGHSEKMYRTMLNEEYAAAISRQGGIGIADQVYQEILKLQEVEP